MIDIILRIIEKLVDYFTKRESSGERNEGLDDMAELKKNDPDDPTMFVRIHKRKK